MARINPTPYQNTNSGALIRLKPLENNDIGSLVEEHIRYWRKYKDDQEAQQLARKAKEDQFKAKLQQNQNKDYYKLLEGVSLDDSSGYFRDQIVSDFEKNRGYLSDLAFRASRGDYQARIQFDKQLANYKELTSMDKLYQKTAQEKLVGGRDNPNFNPALDENIMKRADFLSKSLYKIENGRIVMPDENDPTKITVKTPSELKNDFLLRSDFSGKFNPITFSKDIASSIKLDDENGNRKVDNQIIREARINTRTAFQQNPNALKSWAFEKGYSREKLNNLTEEELANLSNKFSDEVVLSNFQEVNRSLDNTNKLLTAKKKRQDIEKNDTTTTITPSTDESGQLLNDLSQNVDIKLPFIPNAQDQVFNLSGNPITFGVKGKSGTNKTYTSLIRTKDGNIFALGQETVKENIPLYNADGSIQEDTNGNQKFTTRETAKPILEYDKALLNNIARKIKDKKDKPLNDLGQLNNFLDELLGNSNQPSETPEERRIRLRKEAGLTN